MSDITKVVLIVFLGIVVLFGSWFGITQWQRATADYRGETGMIENVDANAEFRQQAYEKFFDLCASVQTDETRISGLQNERDTTGPSDSRKEQINASITAIQSSRAGKINQYNSDAAKDWTSGQFLDSGLPYRLDVNKEKTTCEA
jgi:hypothetical protein